MLDAPRMNKINKQAGVVFLPGCGSFSQIIASLITPWRLPEAKGLEHNFSHGCQPMPTYYWHAFHKDKKSRTEVFSFFSFLPFQPCYLLMLWLQFQFSTTRVIWMKLESGKTPAHARKAHTHTSTRTHTRTQAHTYTHQHTHTHNQQGSAGLSAGRRNGTAHQWHTLPPLGVD